MNAFVLLADRCTLGLLAVMPVAVALFVSSSL